MDHQQKTLPQSWFAPDPDPSPCPSPGDWLAFAEGLLGAGEPRSRDGGRADSPVGVVSGKDDKSPPLVCDGAEKAAYVTQGGDPGRTSNQAGVGVLPGGVTPEERAARPLLRTGGKETSAEVGNGVDTRDEENSDGDDRGRREFAYVGNDNEVEKEDIDSSDKRIGSGESTSYGCHGDALLADILVGNGFRVVARHRELAAGGVIVEVELTNVPDAPTLIAIQDEFGDVSVPMEMRCNQAALAIIREIVTEKGRSRNTNRGRQRVTKNCGKHSTIWKTKSRKRKRDESESSRYRRPTQHRNPEEATKCKVMKVE